MKPDKMMLGAVNALKTLLAVGKGKTVLVITDAAKYPIGQAFHDGARELGAKSSIYTLSGPRPIKTVPAELAALIEKYKPNASEVVFVNAFTGMGEETPMRISLIQTEMALGAKVGHAPGIDETMMTEGPMNVDFTAVSVVADNLMKRFEKAAFAHITAPGGTDLTLAIKGREFESDLNIRNGAMGNLPAGEIWCAPVEDGADGVIVTDGSIGDLGQVPKPLRIDVKKGRLNKLSGGTPALIEKLEKLLAVDDWAMVIGELGIGLNPKARITGNLLEDEKAGETAHIAFGNNTEMPSGKNESKTHRDFLFYKPTVEVTFTDGHKEILLKDGKVTK